MINTNSNDGIAEKYITYFQSMGKKLKFWRTQKKTSSCTYRMNGRTMALISAILPLSNHIITACET